MFEFPAVKISLPGGEFQPSHDRVRADDRMRLALDGIMIPALEAAGSPSQRLQTFEKGRVQAVGTYYNAVASNHAYLIDREKRSLATGSGPHPVLDALDRVSADILDTWFLTLARAVADGPGSREERAGALSLLEGLARDAVPWRPEVAENVVLGLILLQDDLRAGE